MANLSAGSVTIDFLGRNTALTRTFAQVERQVGGFVGRLNASFRNIQNPFGAGQLAGLTAFTGGLAAAFGLAEKAAATFESQMAKVGTLMTGRGAEWVPFFSSAVRDLAKETGESTAVLTDALFEIISAGVPASSAIDVLRAATIAAKAGFTTTEVAAKGLTSVLASYRISADAAADVTDKLFKAAQIGRLNFEGMANSLGRIAPAAKIAGVGLDELLASFAALTQTLTPDEAATSLQNFFRSFIDPSDKARAAAAQFGIELNAAAIRGDNLVTTLEKLRGLSAETIFQIFPETRAARGAASLVQSLNFLRDSLRDIRTEASGSTLEAFGKVAGTTAARFGVLKQSLLDVARTIGDVINDSVRGMIDQLIEATKAIQTWVSAHTTAIAQAARFGVVLASVGSAMTAVIVAFKAVTAPLRIVAVTIAAIIGRIIDVQVAGDTWAAKLEAVAVIVAGWAGRVSAAFGSVADFVAPLINALADTVVAGFQFIRDNVLPAVADFSTQVAASFAGAVEFVTPILDSLWKTTVIVFTAIVDFLAPAANTIGQTIRAAFEVIEPFVMPVLFALRDAFRETLFQIAFVAQNWKDIVAKAFLSVQLAVVTLWEDTKFFLGTRIPEVLAFLGRNWREVFIDIGNFSLAILTNVGKNLGDFFIALWKFIKAGGQGAFEFDFTPLTEGFESAIKEIPNFTQRQMSETERVVAEAMNNIDADLAKREANLRKTFFGGGIGGASGVPGFVTAIVDPLQQLVKDALGLARLEADVRVPPFSATTQVDETKIGDAVASASKASFVGLEDLFKRIQESAASGRVEERQAKAAEDTAKQTAQANNLLNTINNSILKSAGVPQFARLA